MLYPCPVIDTMNEYTTPQLAELVGIPQRKLLSYIERGYISPSVQEASGHGTRRLWSFEDAVLCCAMHTLLDLFSVRAARLAAKPLQEVLLTEKPSKVVLRIQDDGGIGVYAEEAPPWPRSYDPEALKSAPPAASVVVVMNITDMALNLRVMEHELWGEGA